MFEHRSMGEDGLNDLVLLSVDLEVFEQIDLLITYNTINQIAPVKARRINMI